MRYSDLYTYAQSLIGDFVPLRDLARKIKADHSGIEEIEFWPVDLDPHISLGHMKYERGRTSPYDAPFTIATIRYDKRANRCWTRFICCKELMHVFDDDAQSVNSREKFLKLMDEWQTRPLEADLSAMFTSEVNAEWMALLILCPLRLRTKWFQQWSDKSVSDYDVALALRIPEAFVKSVMSDYYLEALETLTR
jgi:hypothetical protein